MANFSIDRFKSTFSLGGARPNLFQVIIEGNETITAMCKAATLPASDIAKVEVAYMGRKLPVRGDRTYADLSLTFYNEEDFKVRTYLEQWIEDMSRAKSNRSTKDSRFQYYRDIQVQQFGKGGSDPLFSYTFKYCFPSTVSEIALDWGTNDTVEEFTATFPYAYWLRNGVTESEGGATPQ